MSAPTVASIGLGSSIAGGIMNTVGGIMSGQANQQMYNYQAQMAQINAQIALQNRDYALQKGGIEAQNYGMKARQQAGQIKSAQAASGIDINSGSAKEVQESQHLVAMSDLDTIRSNAAKTAYDYTVQSTNFSNQAAVYTAAGQNASQAGWLNGIGSFVGMAGSVSNRWLQGQQMG